MGPPAALTIGSFDGVHRGHRRLLARTVALARQRGGIAVAVTFDPHPRSVVDPDHFPSMLTSVSERCDLLAAAGIDEVVVLQFSAEVAQWSAEDFCAQLVAAYPVSDLVVGRDFALGHQRRGDVGFLRGQGSTLGFTVHAMAPVRDRVGPISSSRIRASLQSGDVATARRLLGHPWFLDAVVEHGNKVGRTLGFPTANLGVDRLRCLPATGIYTAWVRVKGRWHQAAASIGYRPTFHDTSLTVEAHLLAFDEDIYDEMVRIAMVGRLRDERAFAGVEALIAQMRRDVVATRQRLAGRHAPSELMVTSSVRRV